MRLLICEPEDRRVAEAMRRCPAELGVVFETFESNGDRDDITDPYARAIRRLAAGSVDAVIAGATIALSEFLTIAFSTLHTSRKRTLLFSAAAIEPESGDPFLLVDPCVVPAPEPSELALMASGAASLYRALYARDDPFVAVLSHATGSYRHHADEKAAAAVKALQHAGEVPFSEAVLQLDAALSSDAAHRKAVTTDKRPNVLLCTELGVANAIYKTLEVFGRTTTRLSGAILLGLDHRLIGLLPRTCTADEVLRLFSHVARAVRGFAAR